MGVYNRAPLAFERGQGVRLWALDGTEYLDCVAGIATNALGHANPKLVQALKDQAEKLWHVSNIFTIPGQEELADALCDATFADVVFFTNSGTEAVECALKTARKYHCANGQPERIDIIGFDGSFHGRTYAAVNAAGQPELPRGLRPAPAGLRPAAVRRHGGAEGGRRPDHGGDHHRAGAGRGRRARRCPTTDLRGLRQLCDETGVLLIYDEIQCGLGRTGKLFAYEWARARSRTSCAWPRRWAAASRSAPAWPPPRRPRA